MQKNGASNAELANFLDKSTAGNKELILAFGGVRNQYIRAERAERAAQNNAMYKANIMQMIENGTSSETILKYAAENGSLSMEEQSSLNKELTDRDNGTGSYSVDISQVKPILDSALDGLSDMQKAMAKEGFRKGYASWLRQVVAETGEEPSHGDKVWYANQLASEQTIRTTKVNHWWQDGDNYSSQVAPMTLLGNGFVDYQPIMGDDGGHYVRLKRADGTFEDVEESVFHNTYGNRNE